MTLQDRDLKYIEPAIERAKALLEIPEEDLCPANHDIADARSELFPYTEIDLRHDLHSPRNNRLHLGRVGRAELRELQRAHAVRVD